MNSLFRFIVLGLIALMSCQQPFQGLEIEQKEPESRVTPDTVWDVANVLYDVGSAVREHARGNHKAAKEHWQAAAIDGAAALVPGLPAGAGAMRAGSKNISNARRAFDSSASTPVGRRGSPMDVSRGTNTGTVIGGRTYTGHALDQMQGRGLTPSVVEDTIARGTRTSLAMMEQ